MPAAPLHGNSRLLLGQSGIDHRLTATRVTRLRQFSAGWRLCRSPHPAARGIRVGTFTQSGECSRFSFLIQLSPCSLPHMDVPMPRRQDAESGRSLFPVSRFLPHMDVPMPRRRDAESGRSLFPVPSSQFPVPSSPFLVSRFSFLVILPSHNRNQRHIGRTYI
jgi:hypothetical protein